MALIQVPGIGAFHAKILINRFGDAGSIFRATPRSLSTIWGIGEVRAKAINTFKEFDAVEKEMSFLEKYRIRPLFFDDTEYPRRLTKNKQGPFLLFYKGTADLNAGRILSVVGTRTPTEYGKRLTDTLIEGLALSGAIIVSGLAYGIDAVAHKAALRHHLPTIGVLGHGLDRIYPEQHAGLARAMLKAGGLLTQFNTGTQPDQHNFPTRNHIISAICDAILVIETGPRGGSMLTAEAAINSKQKIFALPGRVNDRKSAGCNELIRQGKATLLSGPEQVLQALQWANPPAPPASSAPPASPASGPQLSGPQPAPPSTLRQQELPLRPPRHCHSSRQTNKTIIPARQRPSRSPASRAPHIPPPLRPIDEDTLAALSAKEKALLEMLRQTGGLSLDQLMVIKDFGGSQVSLILMSLELQDLIRCMPGKRYIPH
jgi:DNA processing protein